MTATNKRGVQGAVFYTGYFSQTKPSGVK